MVSARSLVILSLMASLSGSGWAQSSKPKSDPIELKPYVIKVSLGFSPKTRTDSRSRSRIVADWLALVERFVGMPWRLDVEEGDGPQPGVRLEGLDPKVLAMAYPGVDKGWIIKVEPATMGWVLTGREFDVATSRLGPICRRAAPYPADAARGLLELALEVFSPSATIGESSGGGVDITIQGAGLPAATELGQVVRPGMVFSPLRIFLKPDGSILKIDDIRWTYLSVKAVDGPLARCAIVSGLKDPLTKRVERKHVLVARGVRVSGAPTRLRFMTPGDKVARPAAGYVLWSKPWPDGAYRELGTTDRDGRITLPPRFESGLCTLLLRQGAVEPMVELPMVPGDSLEERVVNFVAKPATVELEAKLDAIRDAVIDLVAVRGRLEARMKARADGSDWAGLESTLKEYEILTPRSTYADAIAKLKDEAAREQAATKTAILTKTAQAQIADAESLVDRYLDDETYRAYADALKRAKADAAKPAPKSKQAMQVFAPSETIKTDEPAPQQKKEAPKGIVPF